MENIQNLFKKSNSNIQENNVPSSIKYCSSLTFSHKWTIANYSRLYDKDHLWKWQLCSNELSLPNNELFEFQLYLYPKGYIESVKDYVSIGVCVSAMPEIYNGKIKCRWNVSIEDENGDRSMKDELEIYCLFGNEEEVLFNFIEHSSLLNRLSFLLPNNQLTLHFEIHLQADEPILNVITNNEVGRSRFDCANKVTRVMNTWTVENFGELFESSDVTPYFIQSNHFPALNEQSERFCLRLYPNGLSGESKDNVDIAICNDNENSATVHRRISILDVDGEECYTRELTDKIEAKNGIYFGLNRDYLLHNSNGFVYNNQLRIYCEMSYMMDSIEGTETVNQTQMSDSVHKSESIMNITHKAIHFVSHQWTIDKFSALFFNTKTNYSIDSQIFKPLTDTRFAFHLRLLSNSNNVHSDHYLSLDLFNASPVSQVTVQYRISILCADGQKWLRWNNHSTISKHSKVSESKFLLQSILQNPSQTSHFLPNDKLTIICEIWVVQDKKIYKPKPTNAQSIVNNPSTSSAVVNMSNANLQGAIINVQSVSSVGDFNVKAKSNDDKLKN